VIQKERVFQRQQKAVQDETRRTQKFSENRFLKKENFSKKVEIKSAKLDMSSQR
jgi:hypothetical protein